MTKAPSRHRKQPSGVDQRPLGDRGLLHHGPRRSSSAAPQDLVQAGAGLIFGFPQAAPAACSETKWRRKELTSGGRDIHCGGKTPKGIFRGRAFQGSRPSDRKGKACLRRFSRQATCASTFGEPSKRFSGQGRVATALLSRLYECSSRPTGADGFKAEVRNVLIPRRRGAHGWISAASRLLRRAWRLGAADTPQ